MITEGDDHFSRVLDTALSAEHYQITHWYLDQTDREITTGTPTFDLILLEANSGQESSYNFLSNLFMQGSRTPVICFADIVLPIDIERFYSLGAKAFLVKPVDLGEINKLIELHSIRSSLDSSNNTNKSISTEDGEFMSELLHKLRCGAIDLSSLQDKLSEIEPHTDWHPQQVNTEDQPAKKLPSDFLSSLESHCCPGETIDLKNLPNQPLISDNLVSNAVSANAHNSNLSTALKQNEYELILATLTEFHGCRKETCGRLGIKGRTLRYKIAKMKQLGYQVPDAREALHKA